MIADLKPYPTYKESQPCFEPLPEVEVRLVEPEGSARAVVGRAHE